ncbi:hypothetical protein CEXT_66591 [Caerostris extrusa]|uniref:Uncharacterized protein n=1 Tax=Caerostris extrusa TaxID=172846 RepID=A0AAV4MLJ5_CAEEX|nr:hypothetical protein CEXT_66591 [Caerostris extrusa]
MTQAFSKLTENAMSPPPIPNGVIPCPIVFTTRRNSESLREERMTGHCPDNVPRGRGKCAHIFHSKWLKDVPVSRRRSIVTKKFFITRSFLQRNVKEQHQ